MKAIVYTQYGSPDVLQFQEVEKPAPGEDEVLVNVRAGSLNAYDWHMLTADLFPVRLAAGLSKPKNPRFGADLSGVVEAVGKNVTQFQPGDAVFGTHHGAFAEYVVAPPKALALKPAALTFEQAAAVPMAAITALQGLRDRGQVRAGQKVLVNGASGGVGTFAVQIAKALGAEVTAVCSPRNLEMARSLGAEHVIDYTQEDFTKKGPRYDLIFAANGYHSIFAYRRALLPGGRYIMAGGSAGQIFQAMLLGGLISKTGSQQMQAVMAQTNSEDLTILKELIEAGKVKPVIDRVYPFSEAADALRYLGAGHARGKVVLTFDPAG